MKEEINEFLRKLRGKMSLRVAAQKSGLSHTYISALENNKRPGSNTPIKPTPETLKRLADAYNYDYDELMRIAGYIEGENDDKEPINDPQLGLWFKAGKESSAANRQKALEFLEFLEREEKGRKPGDKQNM